MKTKKWFTILEMVIVIGIIAVMMVAFKNVFTYQKKDLLYWESCINRMFGEVNNFLYSAITSKWLYISWVTIYPQQYIINFDTTKNAIILQYNGTTAWTYKYITMTWAMAQNYYCTNAGYQMFLSWSTTTVTINKGLTPNNNMQNFFINTWWIFSWSIGMIFCYANSSTCKELWSYAIDIRTQSIKNKLCTSLDDSNGKCLKRNQ
jgi:hypothetical protein